MCNHPKDLRTSHPIGDYQIEQCAMCGETMSKVLLPDWARKPVQPRTSDDGINEAIDLFDDNCLVDDGHYTTEGHGFGWCDRCHSYCYGDCEANS